MTPETAETAETAEDAVTAEQADVRAAKPARADVAAALAAGDVDRAVTLARDARAAHPGNLVVADQAVAALDHAGRHDEAHELALGLVSQRLDRLRPAGPSTPPPALGPEHRIMIAGFFYSGSGCALDYLKAFPGTFKWAPSGEWRLVKSPGGLADLARRHERQGHLTAADVVDLYLHVVGAKVIPEKKGVYSHRRKVNKNSRRLFKKPQAVGYLATCLDLVAVADRFRSPASGDHEALAARFRAAAGDALAAGAHGYGAQVLLIDQAINAWRMSITHLVPPSTFVVVHRDPRDHFAEVLLAQRKTGRKRGKVERFVKQYRDRHDAFDDQAAAAAARSGHTFVRLRFEDFVLDHAEQSRYLCEQLGIDPAGFDPERFDIAGSRPNVGKHHYVISDAERDLIVRSLPDYLHPAADEPAPGGPPPNLDPALRRDGSRSRLQPLRARLRPLRSRVRRWKARLRRRMARRGA